MQTIVRVGSVLGLGGLLFAGAVALWAYRASQQVPEFYQRALAADPQAQSAASDAMIQQSLDLASEVRTAGHWEAEFTAEQINGWLAVDLAKNHPHLLSGALRDPRVAIHKQSLQFACRYQTKHLSTVCSLDISPSLTESNVIALRVRGARAGALPLPLHEILDAFSHAAASADIQLRWRTEGDDPVALITLPSIANGQLEVRLTRLELRDGAIYLAGETTAMQSVESAAHKGSNATRQH